MPAGTVDGMLVTLPATTTLPSFSYMPAMSRFPPA